MSADFQTKTFVQPRASLLILRPTLECRFFFFLFGGGFGAAGVTMMYGMISDPHSEFSLLWLPVISLLIALLTLLAYCGLGKYSFDLARKELTETHLWIRRTRDLTDIVHIKVVPGGEHSRGDNGGTYASFKLEVFFKNPEEEPLVLADDAAITSISNAAVTLARFLDVPMSNEALSTTLQYPPPTVRVKAP